MLGNQCAQDDTNNNHVERCCIQPPWTCIARLGVVAMPIWVSVAQPMEIGPQYEIRVRVFVHWIHVTRRSPWRRSRPDGIARPI